MAGVMQLLVVMMGALVAPLAAAGLARRLRGNSTNSTLCKEGDRVRCPGSSLMCAGDQCCPGTPATMYRSFSCPSAEHDFADCGKRRHKMVDCLDHSLDASLPEIDACEQGASVRCPGSDTMCAGDQCCPAVAASGNKSFPCPSASESYAGCESPFKVRDCLAQTLSLAESTCEQGASVRCPGSDTMCAGDQCCPATAMSGNKSFPCPSASESYAGCESAVKVDDCLRR